MYGVSEAISFTVGSVRRVPMFDGAEAFGEILRSAAELPLEDGRIELVTADGQFVFLFPNVRKIDTDLYLALPPKTPVKVGTAEVSSWFCVYLNSEAHSAG